MSNEHRITLRGPALEQQGMSGHLLRDLVGLLVQGTERSLRYRIEGRSTARGTAPAWLRSASDFQLVTMTEARGERTLEVRARPLLESMPGRFGAMALSEDIDPRRSPFEFFEDALSDALLNKSDSDAFDHPLLETCAGVGSVLGAGLDSIEIKNGRTLLVDREGVGRVAALASVSFSPRAIRLAGRLETIRHSDCRFTLILANGTKVAGTAKDLGPEKLQAGFGHEVIVSGTADFRPSGRLLRITAEEVEPASEKDLQIFAAIPRPLKAAASERPTAGGGFAALLGKWPGDEPTEQLLEQLRIMA